MILNRVIYTSQATSPYSRRDLLDLLHDARAYNSIDNINGFLFYRDGFFIQIIEGKTEDVNNLISRIEKDTRHFNINIVSNKSVENHLFSNWSMGCTDFNDPELSYIPGINSSSDNNSIINTLIQKLPEVSAHLLNHPEINIK